ncbi:RHS repeat-associated core domain-containing protein [Pseudomonas koreensis]|uniref:RHS repeat-associated core domain-containing protein n=1 Tax=Pseudomonas koreensis TaxID=198620 RepID=UPI001F0137BE|nr:RHS repeat-associated core domain-containing protein [Pseudomonas koreensis]
MAVRQIAYLRKAADAAIEPLITRQYYNVIGAEIEKWDARLFGAKARPNLATVSSLNGQPLKIDSVDAGWRLTLPGLAGEPLQRWDQRGSHWHMNFDQQLRVVAVEENGEPDVDVFIYAGASAKAQFNQRGRLLEQKDRAGSLLTDSFSLTGPPLCETRTFQDGEAFTSAQVFSPLGALLEQTDAGGHQRRSRYGLAGHLKKTELLISGTPDWQEVLQDAQYNANDQIIEQLAGNRVLSQWTYDPADGRLHTQSSHKDGGGVLQNLEYFYDRVGNITRIADHAFQPRYFANQLIDGHRDFTYDSLYRLTSATGYDDAPPPDIPGLPQPGDPNNRLNYTQTYQYDRSGNLTKLCHVRAGNNFTQQMRIDPQSNRGVRWKQGDAEPDFDKLFDTHGNQQALQPGQSMSWNARDQLLKVTLLPRTNGRNDAEGYGYSRDMRVFKRYETFTATTEHFQQVRYLPGLEIRTRDNGEELHVITLGNARCLHWAEKKPNGIATDQLRYNLEDHLGSCVMELDQQAQLISEEGFYPFGATAWMTAPSEIEVSYKFIRYSGKEMDVSGLYYYGARYYAPWLQRWVSADPAGDIDGLNLYAFVANNPVMFIDQDGQVLGGVFDIETADQRDARKARSAEQQQQYKANMALSTTIGQHLDILKLTSRRAQEAEQQILNHRSAGEHGKSAAIRTGAHVGGQAVSYAAGIGIGATTAALGSVTGPVGVAFGVFLGVLAKKAVSLGVDYLLESFSLSASVKFKSGKLDPQRIIGRSEFKSVSYGIYATNKFKAIGKGIIELNPKGWLKGFKEGATSGAGIGLKYAAPEVASEASAAFSTLAGTFEILHEISGAGVALSPQKLERADAYIDSMIFMLEASVSEIDRLFDEAGRDSIHTFVPFEKLVGKASGDTGESIRSATDITIGHLRRTQARLKG